MKPIRSYGMLLLLGLLLACSKEEAPEVITPAPQTPVATENEPPVPPSDPFPEDGSTLLDFTDIPFSWKSSDPDGDDLTYRIGLSLSPSDFGTLASDLKEAAFVLDILEPGRTYYWQVIARDAKGLSSQSEVFSFSVPDKVINGDFFLQSQSEVDAFGANNYTRIIGELSIYPFNPSDITDLAPLQTLYSISETLELEGTGLVDFKGLEGLSRVDGGIFIIGNPDLETMQGLNNLEQTAFLDIRFNNDLVSLRGLDKLKGIQFQIGINSNDDLLTLEGLEALTDVKYVNISYNGNLQSLAGLEGIENTEEVLISYNTALTGLEGLSNLRTSNNFTISNNFGLTGLEGLENVVSIAENLVIEQNAQLRDLSALNRLQSVGTLFISENEALPNLSGLENLNSCNGIRIIRNASLRQIDALSGISELEGYFQVTEHPELVSLAGIQNLQAVGKNLIIESNPSLQDLRPLNALRSVGEELRISYLPSLPNLEGLESLEQVGGNVLITDNETLFDFCALRPFFASGLFVGSFTCVANAYNPEAKEIAEGICKKE